MSPVVAVAHYPEGAGHATRMLAVAKALEARGATVHLAGGGPGSRFIELNGYDQYVPTEVDYIGDFQGGGGLVAVLTNSVPKSAKRVRDFAGWLRRIDPDALVTDDMFAAMAASITRTRLYVLTHNSPGYYDDPVETQFTRLLTRYQVRAAEEFFYPAVWPPWTADPAGVTHIPPVALDADPEETEDAGDADDTTEADAPTDVGVLMVPSHYSDGFADVESELRDAGHTVTRVGGADWTATPSMLPHLRAADVVVCSGYSTVMEAAVAGTPCVIYPFTDEQRGVARIIEQTETPGFAVEHTVPDVLDAVANPPEAPTQENGAPVVAERILEDL